MRNLMQDKTDFDTWLSEDDVTRLWKVCHGELDQSHASLVELNEFERFVTKVAMVKIGGPEALTATRQ